MGFSPEWEQRYADNTHLSVWPWSDLVSLVHRHCKPAIASGRGRVLELGCGAGANIPLFLSIGMDYSAIEGSPSIVKRLLGRYPQLGGKIVVGDFTRELPFDGGFDLVVDRASLTHNTTDAIRSALQLAFIALKPSGVFIGSDWFSTNHDDYAIGDPSEDRYTRTNHDSGQFAGVGRVHFSDEAHLRDLFSSFKIVYMEEKRLRRVEPRDNHQFASWNIVAIKPNP